jgi:hypothetical protein
MTREFLNNYWLVNLTPHTIHLHTPHSGEPLALESRGEARCAEIVDDRNPIQFDYFGDSGMHMDVPLVAKRWGAVTGLPEAKPHTLYIVSTVVQSACPERPDLIAPHDIVRDGQGRVIGCRAFALADRG